MPKPPDAAAGATQKRAPRNIIAAAIRPESKYPVCSMVVSCHLQRN